MFRLIPFLSAFLFLISCGQNKQEHPIQTSADSTKVDTVAILNDPKNNLNIQTNKFSEIDSSGILIFPLSVSVTSSREERNYSSYSGPPNNYWNIIFLNSKTNKYKLLSEKKMLISNYDITYGSHSDKGNAAKCDYIFYTITSEDYNKDKILNDDDPQYLFISDRDGNNFRQISPSNYDLHNWSFIKSSNKIIMTVRKDSNKDNHFNDKDEVTTFEVEPNKDTEPREVFSTDLKSKLKILYDRDWKHLKK